MSKLMSRREFLGVAAGTAGALSLAACAPAADSESDGGGVSAQDLIMWHFHNGPEGEVLDALVAQYSTENDVGIKVTSETYQHRTMQTKMMAAWAAGKPIDVVNADGQEIILFATKKMLNPITDLLEAEGHDWSDYDADIIEAASWAGELLAMPQTLTPWALLYNKDHLDEAGIDVASLEGPQEKDDFIKLHQELVIMDGDTMTQVPYGCTTSGGEPVHEWGFALWQNEGDLLNEDGTRAAFNNDAGIAACQWVLDLFDKHKISSRALTGWDNIINFQGPATVTTCNVGPWWINSWRDKGFTLAASQYPLIAKKRAVWKELSGMCLVKTGNEEKLKAGAHMIQWISENQQDYFGSGGLLPAQLSQLNLPEITGEPLFKPFIESQEFGVMPPPTPGALSLHLYGSPILKPLLDRVWAKDLDPAEALATAETECNELLDETWGNL